MKRSATFCIALLAVVLLGTGAFAAPVKNFLDLCRSGGIMEVRAAIDRGANLDMRRSNGFTPLMEAIFNKDPNVFTMLIERGANVDARDSGGATALVNLLRFGTNLGTGVEGQARALIAAGADPNIQTDEGQTALMVLTSLSLNNPYPDTLVEMLLDAGADPSLKDNDGRTAWDYAFENKKFEGSPVMERLKVN